ncbi:GTP cyclohydrolase II [Pleomorphochaeta sp. DL1XJH-081]|jgi:3,4-dihydroxy 2-butanone 4-phosphate synthase/GTP cyclohydrolase II|uniref:GTP cyclohydrolase II n=1 Tax=Pleomorphochaeta sp. DL1XJH-081 TaxID=3409690 RepID=UPI003BB6E150
MEFSTIEEALAAIRSKKIVVVVDDKDREHEGDLIAAAEFATPEIINFMVTHGKGLVCVPLDETIIDRLELSPMTTVNRDVMGTAFTISVDHTDTTTGISAFERSLSIQRLAAEDATAKEFRAPGHVFPLKAKHGGVLERPGHTESAVDLARYAGLRPAAVICEILKEDGSMARTDDLFMFARKHGLPIISVNQLVAWRLENDQFVMCDSVVDLPTEYGEFKSYTYMEYPSGNHHVALVMGDPNSFSKKNVPLVRMHSECLTGDVFHSLRCDCGEQLKKAMDMISQEGEGILIYLRQEGRGIGLPNKMRAYRLQEEGHDTVQANIALGFAPDERKYDVGAKILHDLGATAVRLLTNNPAKIEGLERRGVVVSDRVPVVSLPNVKNIRYLKVKSEKMGHLYEIKSS